MKKITKAIFPVAGLGTRFLPATKAIPKEMLPIIDKPLIEYAVEEAVLAGIEEIIFITSHTKPSIQHHFSQNQELEEKLIQRGNFNAIKKINRDIFKDIKFTYVHQESQRGLGDAILQARICINQESFAVLLADDLIINEPSATQQLINVAEKNNSSVLGLNRVPEKDLDKYGVISPLNGEVFENMCWVENIIEKPKENPPSNMAVFGRYILSHHIFDYLENLTPGYGDEIQLTDAIKLMLRDHPVAGYLYDGNKFDCGSRVGYVKAIQYLASEMLDV
ncbi:UTP--glucose-1-phosphate uridylyltransferase [Gammaproteobacteria bacterium]|jgi:UTP--glucose-1-phosphate uridylyltransferase|nr:UTP--glucose-1-phosphate uridylyltransferase [Gammaproteobacteria bacterium]|tara:strand:+ start:868 stop:1701 length:834 start_codon:yes stop_codon:yes gene_type:complete